MAGAELDAVYAKFWELTQKSVQPWKDDKSLFVESPTQDMKPDPKMILLSARFKPSTVIAAEKGGPEALSIQTGIWFITFSRPKAVSESKVLKIARGIQKTFRRNEFQTNPSTPCGCLVYCDDPEFRDAGETPDKRFLSTISVPWWVWISD